MEQFEYPKDSISPNRTVDPKSLEPIKPFNFDEDKINTVWIIFYKKGN